MRFPSGHTREPLSHLHAAPAYVRSAGLANGRADCLDSLPTACVNNAAHVRTRQLLLTSVRVASSAAYPVQVEIECKLAGGSASVSKGSHGAASKPPARCFAFVTYASFALWVFFSFRKKLDCWIPVGCSCEFSSCFQVQGCLDLFYPSPSTFTSLRAVDLSERKSAWHKVGELVTFTTTMLFVFREVDRFLCTVLLQALECSKKCRLLSHLPSKSFALLGETTLSKNTQNVK